MSTTEKTSNNILSLVFREFIYGGHLQCLGAASIAFVSAILLDLEIQLDCLIAVYLIFYPLYLYNRYKELETDAATNPERTQHFRKYVKIMPFLLWGVIVAAFSVVAINSNLVTLGFTFILITFGLLYTILFKRLTKTIPIFKNLYVAAFFALLVVFPVLFYGYQLDRNLTAKIVALFSFVYLNALAMQVFLDIKDIESDKHEKLLTIPILLGKPRTISCLYVFTVILSVGFPLVFATISNVLPKLLWALSLSIPFNFYSLGLIRNNNYNGYILTGAQFLMWFVFIGIGRLFI